MPEMPSALRHVAATRYVAALAPDLDPDAIRSRLAALDVVVCGRPEGGALARLPISERFGWLVANSSTVVQPSEVHTGLTDDPAATLARLFQTLVGWPPAAT